MVSYIDGSTSALLSDHDMRIPIFYALNWPSREHYKINDKIFIYGFSNRIDLEKKIFTAKISIDDKYLYNKKLYFNPISDYYFSQFNIDNFGNYKIEIIDENDFILETISVNIVEELSKL